MVKNTLSSRFDPEVLRQVDPILKINGPSFFKPCFKIWFPGKLLIKCIKNQKLPDFSLMFHSIDQKVRNC